MRVSGGQQPAIIRIKRFMGKSSPKIMKPIKGGCQIAAKADARRQITAYTGTSHKIASGRDMADLAKGHGKRRCHARRGEKRRKISTGGEDNSIEGDLGSILGMKLDRPVTDFQVSHDHPMSDRQIINKVRQQPVWPDGPSTAIEQTRFTMK
jgi:hypothetical protein